LALGINFLLGQKAFRRLTDGCYSTISQIEILESIYLVIGVNEASTPDHHAH
jgi:hypothetical protein